MVSILNISLVLLLSCVVTCRGMSHDEAVKRLEAAGIAISSRGGCSDRNKAGCTSLEGIRESTIVAVETVKSDSKCPITVTGGTETGHKDGQAGVSHWNGYKLDLAFSPCTIRYITGLQSMGARPNDAAPMFRSNDGTTFIREEDHWDMTHA